MQLTPKGPSSMPVRVLNTTQNRFVVEQMIGEPRSFAVNYRVTGIREGYEDKQVVRKMEEPQNATAAS